MSYYDYPDPAKGRWTLYQAPGRGAVREFVPPKRRPWIVAGCLRWADESTAARAAYRAGAKYVVGSDLEERARYWRYTRTGAKRTISSAEYCAALRSGRAIEIEQYGDWRADDETRLGYELVERDGDYLRECATNRIE